MEALPQPWCVVDALGHLVHQGLRWMGRFGAYAPRQAVLDDYRAEFERRWAQGVASGSPWSFEARWLKSGHNAGWALLWMQPLDDGLWLGTLTDTDAQKTTEAQLREADAVWKLALEATGDGVWDWDLASNTELYSPNMLALYGYGPDEVALTPQFFDELTHPDDREAMAADRDAHFSGAAPQYRNEHRVRCKDGNYKWILTRGMVISRDAQGKPLRMVGTHTDITERKATEVLAWKQANFDALTGLPNRRMLADRLQHAIKKSQRTGLRLALLMIDLDHFKAVNDAFGHDVGDALLIEAAHRARAVVREVDMVARLGGDEFVVLLTDLGPHNEVIERVAGQLVRRLGEPYDLPAISSPTASTGPDAPAQAAPAVGASLGIALFPDDADSDTALHKHADQALYAAKRAGRGAYHYFTPGLQLAAQARTRLGHELRDALAHNRFALRFVPLRRRGMPGWQQAEVQMRWLHPALGELGPASFMPGAESSGLVHDIGDWLLRESAQWLRQWRAAVAPDLGLSVNLAGSQLRHWGQSVPEWAARLMRLGVSGGGLTLDIDETQLSDPQTLNLLHLPALRAAGIQLALDGFGDGRSNLASLRHPGLHSVKLSRAMCQGVLQGSTADWLRAIVDLAHAMGLLVIAKGVESEAQAQQLAHLGVDGWQGNWVSAPLNAEAFGNWLQGG